MAEQAIEPLLAELRSVVDRADPIPDAVIAAARASFGWRTIDAELAELVADSASSTSAATDSGRTLVGATRAGAAPRLLTFEGAGLTVEVEVAETGPTATNRHLVGQLIPVGPASITVRWSGGTRVVAADEFGRFAVDDIPAGPISMAVARAGAASPVVTSWVAI
jgi:hypothetical protein